MAQGWIKLHRKLLENPIFQNAELLQLFIYCLLKANHEPKKIIFNGKEELIGRGQFITGRDVLSKELKQNGRTTYDRLKILQNLEIVNIKSNNKFSLVTIENYNLYQSIDENTNSNTNNEPTTNQQPANNEPTQTRTNKNDKNEENDKNNISVDKPLSHKFTIPTLEEVKVYCIERNNNIDANIFIDFYTSKGWMIGKNKMKDWQSAIRTWERKNKDNPQQQKQQYKQAANDNKRQYNANDLEKMLLGR